MWQTKNNQLYQKFAFKDFHEALEFINQVGDIAKQLNHHPKINNVYNVVELWLSTHDAGDTVTDKDRELAKQIDQLVSGSKQKGAKQPGPYKQIKLYADGGSRGNPGPSASGFVLTDMKDQILLESGVYLGITTNNQAEYQALKFGLEEAEKIGAREVDAYMDSLLVINQMKGIFKVKNRDLWPIHQAIKNQAQKFKKITFTHIPRELNKLADAEVNKTLDATPKSTK